MMTTNSCEVAVHGTCDPAFNPLLERFTTQVRTGSDIGASVAVVVNGHRVVDLWAGSRDQLGSLDWTEATVVPVASATKALTSLCVHLLADRGLLELDAQVATYWPEFGAAGKADSTVRQLLGHRVGLVGERDEVPKGPDRLSHYLQALAAQEPFWTPGTEHGYHAKVFHLLVGELVRRVSGVGIEDFFHNEINGPFALDAYLSRDLVPDDIPISFPFWSDSAPPPDDQMLALLTGMSGGEDPIVRAAFAADPPEPLPRAGEDLPISSGGAATNARTLALVYGALAHDGSIDGKQLLSPESCRALQEPTGSGHDLVLGFEVDRCAGYFLNNAHGFYGPSPEAFGHDGAGGSAGFGDPTSGVGFGYATNSLSGESVLLDARKLSLVEALYSCL